MKDILPAKDHKLIDDWDQDHGMILGQGTAGDIFQSIMVKPPNVKPVYPMVNPNVHKDVELDLKFKESKYVYIFNLGRNTPDNVFYNNPEKVAKFLEVAEGNHHVIIAENGEQVSKLKDVKHRQVVISEDPSYVKIARKHEN